MPKNLTLFFSLYTLIYGGMHLYVYFKLRSALGPGWKWTLLYALVSLAMVFGARALFAFNFRDAYALRKILSYAGYLWMAFLFITATGFVLTDLLGLFLRILDYLFSSTFAPLFPSSKGRVLTVLIFSTAVCVFGWFDALHIRTVPVTVATSKLPDGVDRIRVAQISDVHLGWVVQEERLALMLDAVKAAEPDMVVITGDLVDGAMEDREGEAVLFRGLNPPLGVYGVTGNHEYYAGLGQALDFMDRAGIRVLRNEALEAGGIAVAGVDDPTGRRLGHQNTPEVAVLSTIPSDRFVILLKHQPILDSESEGLFDLQLSGHTHGGQIWPFSWATRLVYKHPQGLSAATAGGGRGQAHAAPGGRQPQIYISNGTGTWGPPLRFLSPPEVTVFDIVREK